MKIESRRATGAAISVALITALSACSGDVANSATMAESPPTPRPSSSGPQAASHVQQPEHPYSGAHRRIGPHDVRDAAVAATKVATTARIYSIEPELSFENRPVWTVKLITREHKAQFVVVDVATRQASRPRAVIDDDKTKHRDELNRAAVSWKDAAKIATQRQPGGTLGKVSIDSLDHQPHTSVWKITVLTANQTIKYKVDAKTKAVVKTETENRDQHDFD